MSGNCMEKQSITFVLKMLSSARRKLKTWSGCVLSNINKNETYNRSARVKFRTIWDYLRLSGTIWHYLDYLALYGTIGHYLGLSGTISDTFEQSLIILDYIGLFRTFSESLRLSGTIWDYLRLSETILCDYPGLSCGTIQDYLV